MKPKISIIVRVYNVEKYLRKCLDSILAQTFTDWECILVDDGSPDNSGRICDEYADKDNRFRVIHQKNAGSSHALNIGLDNATSEFVYQLDSDDYLPTDALECLIKKQQEADYDIVFGDYTYEYADRNEYCSRSISKDKYDFLVHIVSDSLCPHFISATLVKTELYNKYNVRAKNSIDAGDDLQILTQLVYYAKSYTKIDKSVYFYNQTNINSITQSTSFKRISQDISSIDIVKEFFKQKNETELVELLLISKYYCISQFLISLSNRNDSNYYKMRLFIQKDELKQIYYKLSKRSYAFVLKINNLTISRIYCKYLSVVFILLNLRKRWQNLIQTTL